MSFKVEITKPGTGPKCPPGATVLVHYTGKLTNGKVFDSSVGGDPLDFQVGVGQVIRGWDEGIIQLNKGAKAILTCPSDYAYGKAGAPPDIPPNATLIFDVELIDFQAAEASAQVRAAHILLKHTGSRNPTDSYRNKPVTRSKQEAIQGIQQIKSQIKSIEDFQRLAKAHSECRSAANGGDLGVFGRGDMQKPFEDATFALQPGEISGLVDTDSGIHIILRLG